MNNVMLRFFNPDNVIQVPLTALFSDYRLRHHHVFLHRFAGYRIGLEKGTAGRT